MKYVVRADSNGEILRTGSCRTTDLSKQAGSGETATEDTQGCLDSTHYYDGANYVLRPSLGLSPSAVTMLTSDTFTVSDIPVNTLVEYPGGAEVVTDGEITWQTTVSGIFEFRFTNFPYVAEVFNVAVTDL